MLLFLQKNMLYIKYINTLSVIGLIAVFVLQTVWFYNTYVYTRENIKKESLIPQHYYKYNFLST